MIAARFSSSQPQFGKCSGRARRSLMRWRQGLAECWFSDLRRRIAATELDMK